MKNLLLGIFFSLLFLIFGASCVSTKQFSALQDEVGSLNNRLDNTEQNVQKMDEQVGSFDRKVEKYKADNDAAILGLEQYAKELYEANAVRINDLEQRTKSLEIQMRQLGQVATKQVTVEKETSKKKKNAY